MTMLNKTVARFLLGWFCISAMPSMAADAQSATADPVLEKKVMAIAEELRCLVCQNQTIADSHAELAVDLKNQVREMLVAGKNEAEIKRYMVERYGDFVLYRPPVKGNTWLLWAGPFALLLVALIFAFVKLRQRGKRVAESSGTFSPEDCMRAERLLGIIPEGQSEAGEAPAVSMKDKA